jgi:hypothetical protein
MVLFQAVPITVAAEREAADAWLLAVWTDWDQAVAGAVSPKAWVTLA